MGPLNDGAHAFEAHAGIDVLCGQRREGAIGIGVVLDENVVPDFDASGVGSIDQAGAGSLVIQAGFAWSWAQIDVDFGARTARPGIAHHPEIVFFVAVDDVDFGIQAGGTEFFGPEFPGFLIAAGRITEGSIRLVNGGIHPLRRKFPDVDDEFPSPRDGFLFEIITEGPIPEHFEECVVIGIEADIFQIVMFTAGSDAFLSVGSAPWGVGAFDLSEEDRDKLIHTGIGEQEVRRVGQQRGGRHNGVLLRFEEIEEALPDLGCGHREME